MLAKDFAATIVRGSSFPFLPPTTGRYRTKRDVCPLAKRSSGGRSYDGENARKSGKGDSYQGKKRRRGRPAWLRSPDDTPLRDGNRDRLMGLLTDRAARTLLYYYYELNPTLFGWFSTYLQEHKIPKDGNWDDVSGETFMRGLLTTPMEETRWGQTVGVDSMYDCTGGFLVDPRNVAKRIMEIRSQIAKEWIEELNTVSEENALLMRESILSSFSLNDIPTTAEPSEIIGNSKVDDEPDDSAGGGDD